MNTSELLTDLLPDVAGCPDPTAERAIFYAAQRLCAAGGVWQIRHDPVSVTPGVATYELDAPTLGRLHTVIAATLDGRRLAPSDYAYILHCEARGVARRFYMDNADITLVPAPDSAGVLHVTATYVPVSSAAGALPDVLKGYIDTLLTGAKSILFEQREQPWTNAALASYHAQAFRVAVSDARIGMSTGHAGAALRAAPRSF